MECLKIQTLSRRILTTSRFIATTSLPKTLRPLLTRQCSSTKVHSAPALARGWDIGRFERFDSCAVLQYEDSSPVRESEPWSHLQTFALSAPGHDDQSSQDFQIEAISQWPSSLQDNEMLRPSTTESCHQRQVSAKHKRMQEDPHSAEGNFTQYSRLRNQTRNARGPHSANFGTFEHRTSHAGEQQMVGSSSSSSFSQPATSGLHMESSPAQLFESQAAYPSHYPTFSELKGNDIGPRQDLETDFSLNRGLIDEAGHSSLPGNQDVLTPQELSWRQHDHLLFRRQHSTSADTAYSSYDLGLTASDHAWPSDFIHDPAFEFATCQTYNDSNTLDHPGAIKIAGSGGHYKSGLTSSFPPSADCFPDYMPTMQKSKPYRAIASTSQPSVLPSSPPNRPSRKNSGKPTSARGSRSGSLSIIREHGHAPQGSPNLSQSGPVKGKRKGPLPPATALAAAQKRKDGNVCIRCRTRKMTVGRYGWMS